MECKAKFIDDLKVSVEINNTNFKIDADRIEGNAPMDYILSALAACTTISITSILKRQHENFNDFYVIAKGEQNKDPPKTFKKVELHYFVNNVKEDKLKKAIELTIEKYSPTAVMLKRAGVEIVYDYILK